MKRMLSLLGLAGILCGANLLVAQTQTHELETIWEKHPDDYPEFFGTNHIVRGMAFNPVTNHLIIASRRDDAVHRIDATDGTYLGTLDMTGVGGGHFNVNKVGVTADGVIYLGNMASNTTEDTFNLYRWADEDAVPVRVYSGNPGGAAPENRWGDSLDVRGTGADTEILLGSYSGSMLAVLRPDGDSAAPDSYAVQPIGTDIAATAFRNVTFGPGNLVYATRASTSLYELEIDFTTGAILNQREFDDSKVAGGISPIGYGEDLLVGIWSELHTVMVYRQAHLSEEWQALPIALQQVSAPTGGTHNGNSNATGEVIVVGDVIYALDTNNSILAARLVEAAPPPPMPMKLETVWEKLPDDFPQFFSTNNLVRGMDYNPVTNHLLIASRQDGAVHRIDAADGSYVGTLDMTGVAGGAFAINKVGVTADGAIYVGNMTTDSTSNAYHLYRWANEDAVPVRVYAGNLNAWDPENRWGDSMDVRGTGADTEILLGSFNGSMLMVLRPGGDPAAPDSYTVQQLYPQVEATAPRSVAFGPGNLVYVKRPTTPFYELEINFETGAVVSQREFDRTKIEGEISPLGYGAEEDIIAAILPGTHELWVYRRSHLSVQWQALPVATKAFPPPLHGTYIRNSNGAGDVIVVGDMIYAMDTNNSILAARLVEGDPPPPAPAAEIYWSNNNEIRGSLLNGDEARTVVGGLLRPIGLAVDAEAGHIYWAEDGVGRIGRANLDGSDPTTVIDGLSQPQDVLLLDGRIYFSQYSAGLFSVDLDGGNLQPVLEVSTQGTSPIAYDEVTGRIHMSAVTTTGAKLYSVNPDGSEPDAIDGFGTNYYGIAFDAAGTLFRANFSLHTVDSYNLETGHATPLFGGYTQLLQIDISEDGSRIYWTERGNGGNVYAANSDGTGDVFTLAAGEESPFGVALVKGVTAGDGFANWIASFDVSEEQRGREDDPDGDGISNLLEYAFGGNPAVANRDLLPIIGVESVGSGEYLSIEYSKNASATGIDYVVEVSEDLVNWNSNETNPDATVTVFEDAEGAVVRDATPMSDANRRFIRLRVIER